MRRLPHLCLLLVLSPAWRNAQPQSPDTLWTRQLRPARYAIAANGWETSPDSC